MTIQRHSARATIGVALFIFGCSVCLANPKRWTNVRQAIERAEELSLQRDRKKAVEVLKEALAKEKTGSPGHLRLQRSLTEIANIFFSESTQKEFELAQALYFGAGTGHLPKYEAAFKLESDNVQILLALARARIGNSQCNEAREVSQKAFELDPYNESTRVMLAASLLCEGAIDLEQQIEKLGANVGGNEKFLQLFWARHWLARGDNSKVAKHLQRAEEIDANYPEIYLVRWQAKSAESRESLMAAEKYVDLCRPGLGKLRRKYPLDPLVCGAFAKLETVVKEAKAQDESPGD